MVKVKKNNRNFEVKKYIKKTTPALMSLLVATSCLNGVHYPKNAYASGVTQKINTGDGGVKVLYANNGLNPLNFSIGDAAIYGHKNVEDVVKISVTFPKNNGQNDYGPESKKVHIKYEFNSNKGAYWAGRPFYWFSLPKNVKEPSNIKITNAKGHSDSIQNWRQWTTNTRFVASRYQNMEDAIKQNEGHPHDWGRFNDRTEEYQKGFNGSLNYQFNRMLDEQDGGWFDENGGTRNFAKSIRNNSKSIYIDWEPRGDGKVTIEVETEVMFPLKSNTLDFAAGAFSVLGNIRIANMQTVTTPHYITYAEKYPLDTPEIMEVDNPDKIGKDVQEKIKQAILDKKENASKKQYLVEDGKYDGYKQIEVKDNGDTTITFRDLSQQTIAGSRLVTKHVPYKDRFGIKIPQTTEVKNTSKLEQNEINAVKEAIFDANKDNKEFIKGIGGEDKKDSAITVTEKGEATIKYIDGTKHEIEANKLVTRYIPLSEKYEPLISVTTGVVNKDSLTTAEQEKVKQVLVEINKRANHAIIEQLQGGEQGIQVDSKGKATLTYKDNSTDTIDPSRLIYQIPKMNERFTPVPGNRTAVDDDQNVKDEEKRKIIEELKKANPDIFKNGNLKKDKGLDNSGVEFDSKGEATFHYADGTTNKISASRLLYKKGGSSTSPGTELKTNGQFKYYLTPIKIKSWDDLKKNREGLWADAARRFVFDNYTWSGKISKFEDFKKDVILNNKGGNVTYQGGWEIYKDGRIYTPVAGTSNIKIHKDFGDMGVEKIIQQASENLEFRSAGKYGGEDLKFQISKNDLFYIDNPFDKEKAKQQAEQIIEDLKKKGLSEDDAKKLKKQLEDKKDTLTQDKVDEIIKEAEQKSKEGKEKQDLDKAKQEAEKEIGNLKDLDNKEKEKLKEELKQKTTPEEVKKVVDKAREEDSKAKEAKDKKKLLDEAKKQAKEIIKGLKNLGTNETNNFNTQVDSAQDENKINEIVEKAKAQDKANVDKKALDEAKKKAKEIINKLQNLSNEEKKQFTEDNKGSVDKAKTKEEVEKEIKKAQELDKQNKLKLDQAKNKAKEDIGKLKHLSPEERKQFNENIDKAKDQTAIDDEVKKAQEKDKQNAKSKAINDINNSGLTEKEKQQAEQDINNAGSTDEIDKKAEEHLKKAAEEKAKKEKEEADKLKEEYKQKIENTQGLDKTEKEDYKNQINQATTKGQMDSIVEMAQAKAKQKQAKEEIDKLSHLNKKQKESLKDNIDNLISDTDINNEVSKANDLDSKMDTLQKLVAKTVEQDVKDRLNNAKQQDKTNYEKALAEAKKVSEKETGVDADSSTVEQLTKDLEEAINKLNPSKPKVKIDINKEALNKEIKKAKELKEKDIYKNSETKQKTDFESKLKEAEKIANDNNATQDKVEQALADLINAENNLNGKFKLETKDSTPALVGVSDNDGTKVEKETDKKSILDKIKDMPKDAVTSISPVKTDKGKKVVTVTVVKDNVSQTIDIPIKSDTTKPTVQVTNENQDIYKTEEFKEMKITATDENLDTTKDYITVEGLDNNSWLTYDKATKTIKLKNGNTVPKTATTTKVTIKVVDKVGNEQTKDVNITVKSQADKYKPKAKSDTPTRKVVGEKVNSPKDYVENTDKNTQLPQGTTFKWKENNTEKDEITLNEVGNDKEKEVVVIYPDGSKETVKVKFNVVADINLTKQDDKPVYLNETLTNNSDIKAENQEKVKAKVKGIPDGATVTYSKVTNKQGKNYVTVKVSKDGVEKSLEIEVLGDVTNPTITVAGDNPTVYKKEGFGEITLTPADDNLADEPIEVKDLPNWLQYDKATKTIKFANGTTEVPTDATTKKITVTIKDKAGNIATKDITITVKSQSEKYSPESITKDTKSVVTKTVGDIAGNPKNFIKENNKLPNGTTFKWKDGNADTLTLNTVGKDQEKEIEITYPDGSKTTVKVKFNVIDKKPDVPTVTAKDNGDVTIKPAPNTDKISVTYTPTNENAEKTVEIEKDTDGKWKIPAEFSQNDSGEITIPDTVTKNNTAVKVKASNGTSGYTTEKSTTITAKELQEVKTPVTIAGSDNKDTDVTENNRKLILDSLTSDQKGEANASIEQDAKIKEEAGKKYVEVKLEFKDKSTKVIKVPVVGDSTAPQVELSNDNQTVYKKEGFTEIKVNATDSNLADKPIEVKDLPNWLQYDETGKTIKFANGTTEVPTTATTTTVKVIAKDKVGNTTTKEIVITVKSQSDKYSPETLTSDGSKIKKVQGEQSNDAKSYVKNAKDLPKQTKYSWKDEKANPKFDQVGEVEKTITVTFPDGSEKEVKVKFNVVDTKPSEPAVAALKNGDITITPSADSDKVVVGYTPKDSDQEKLVEAKKDQGKWNLPEGFKEENGKIIIPDEITKNNTTVKVKASKGTSDYTTEVTKQLSKTELLPPLKATISGSDAKDTVLTKENADLIIATLTNAQTGGGVASIADGEKIKEDADGSKYVEVTLTYDDQSTKVIKVKVVGDSTGPVFEGLGDASVKKYETFKPIEIKATDAGSALRDNEPYVVENLPSWLEFDKATNKVKLANNLTRVPKEATTVKFKVKAFDKFNNVTEQEVTVTVNEAEEFTFEKPVIIKGKDKDKEKLSPEDEKTILDAVRGTNKLDGATPSIVDKTIKVSGDESSVDVTLTYDDNQTRVINVKVEQDAKLKFGLHLPSEKVEVNDINNLNQVEQAKVLEKVKLANSDLKEKDGYTYTIVAVTGQDKKAGTVTVSKDGKVVGELPGERLVKERDITKYDVALPKVKVQVENKTNLKADEKEKVKEALENATDTKGVSNKDKFPKGTKLEVQGDGTVIISYPDKTTKTISGSDLVDGPSPYVKTIAEEMTPKVPAEKVKVANPSSLDDKEIAKVKEKILEANKDTFPANTTVEVAKDGTATITYKDGSSDTIKNTDLVEKAKEKLTDAKQNPAVKPNAKVEVEDSKKLTDDEKAKVKENVKNTNPKAKDIVVGTDGTVEITYPDGSGNTIKPEDTVVQKAGKTPKESEAVKNPAKVPAVKVQVADTTKLTAEEIAKVKEEVTKVNPNATKVEVSSNGTATLTYKDGSENIVAGEKLVEQKAKGKTLAETVEILVPDVKTEVINPNRLSTAEKEKVKENLKAKNAGKLDSANITVQNNGTVTVEFADGSAKTIDGEKLVTKKADDGKLKPTIADLTDVDAPIYTKVAEYGKLTEIEKEAVKKAVIEANGGEDGKLKDADIKVLGDGTVVITYKDKSTDIIPADKTVNVGQSGSEALVQPALPEYPLDKLKPVADDFITEETQKIKDEINDSNIYSKEEKQKALAKIDEMVKKAKQKVQNAENDDKVLNTINEVLQDAKEFSKNIKENKLAEIAKAKAEAKAEI
ncbi:Rib/alpha-like domain-containing protein, partial [Gemelliphila asaccharolytica]